MAQRKLRAVDALIFDMYGTLIDSAIVVPNAYILTVRSLGGPHYTEEQVIQAYPLGPPRVILTRLLGRPCQPDDLRKYHHCLSDLAGDMTAYPGIVETLSRLSALIPLGVFTGASVEACQILLGRAGLLPCFMALVGGDEVTHPKPHPEGVFLACRRLGVDPGATGFVGDSPLDMEAAKRGGVLAVAAGWGHQMTPNSPADVMLQDPRDLLRLVKAGT